MTPDDPRHGTSAGYVAGCRCRPCTDANTAGDRQRRYDKYLGRPRRVSSLGSQRRIQALLALGWTCRHIARVGGWGTAESVQNILKRPFVGRDTHARIVAVYERLSMKLGPSEAGRARAQAKGWPVPLAWDEGDLDNPDARPHKAARDREVDWAVVERALSGDRVKANAAEKKMITDRWRKSGQTLAELERIQGWNASRYKREVA